MDTKDAPRSPRHRTAPAWLQLKIELTCLRPVIWRRIVVPETIRLDILHEVIQEVMGWSDSHLHEFEIGKERYGVSDPDFDFGYSVCSETTARLGAVLMEKKTFRYVYDFGDGWEHRIKVEKKLPPDPDRKTVLCLSGANACPPDDVGGPPGYENFIEAISQPDHPEHEEMLDWIGGSFDPAAFDLKRTNARLGTIKL